LITLYYILTGVEQEVDLLRLDVHFNTTVRKGSVPTSQKTPSLSQNVSVNIVYRNNRCLFRKSQRTHRFTLWRRESRFDP